MNRLASDAIFTRTRVINLKTPVPPTPGRPEALHRKQSMHHTTIKSLKMLNSRKHCWTALLGLILMVSLAEGERLRHGKRSDISCWPNYYKARTSSGNLECVRCPTGCDPGTTIETQCGNGRPQTCRPCEPTPGKTCASGKERFCVLCDVYGRTVDVQCNIYNQTVCGNCKQGYYENLDDAKIGSMRYCRKCTAEDVRHQCQLQPTVTPSVTPDKPTTSQQMAIMYATIVTQRNEKLPPTSGNLIQRLRQTTRTTGKKKDAPIEWGALTAGFVMTLLIFILFAFVVKRYRSFDGHKGKETTEIELATISEVVEDEYERLCTRGKEVGKDMPIEDHLTLDMQQAIASIINQRPALPGGPDYKNVFIDLGIDKAHVLAANATGITDPSEALFRVLLSESSAREIKMADIITTLDKYKFYDLVKDICREITVQN